MPATSASMNNGGRFLVEPGQIDVFPGTSPAA
jgi:hypothetical protein